MSALQNHVEPKIGAMLNLIDRYAKDTEMLLDLDKFYTHLFGLLMCYEPDPIYVRAGGKTDKKTAERFITESINAFARDIQPLLKQEYMLIKDLLKRGEYQAVQRRITKGSQKIGDLLSDGREAPDYIKEIWKKLPDV